MAEAIEGVAERGSSAAGPHLREAEEPGQQYRRQQHEAAGEGQGHGGNPHAIGAVEQHQAEGDGNRSKPQADERHGMEGRPAIAQGQGDVAEGETIVGSGYRWHGDLLGRGVGRECPRYAGSRAEPAPTGAVTLVGRVCQG